MDRPRPIALLTDFGLSDAYAGICRAVILAVDERIPLIDLTHCVARQDIMAGAVALADAAPVLPERCVVIAIVDPGVGSERRALAVETADGCIFIGPDNGLLMPAIALRGGPIAAREISRSPWCREPVSNTFHARDIFAPVAARIAAGGGFGEAGTEVDPGDLVYLELPGATLDGDALTTAVLAVDAYGNVRLGAAPADCDWLELGELAELDTDDMRRQARFAASYAEGEPREPLLVVDSSGSLSVCVNHGSAASELRLEPGKTIRIMAP